MDLEYDVAARKLLAVCDDTCAGNVARMDVDGTGALVVERNHNRPAGSASITEGGAGTAILQAPVTLPPPPPPT